MAVSFQIDAATMPFDPEQADWQEKPLIDRTHGGAPIYNIKRICLLSWEAMPTADFNTLAAYDNGATHTIKIPHHLTGTYTNYAGAYLRKTSGHLEDINVYGVTFEVSWVEV